MAETRDCKLGIRINCDLKTKLEQAAAQDDRTLSKYVERVLLAHIEKLAKKPRKRT